MPGITVTLPTALTVYRLSAALAAAGVGGVSHLTIQPSSQNVAGKLFLGGSAVSPTNCGVELETGDSYSVDGEGGNSVLATDDYMTSDTDAYKVNVSWRTK